MIRPLVIWTIAWRDWRLQLAGRQGRILPAILFLLLSPVVVAPDLLQQAEDAITSVSGDVPEELLAGVEHRVVDRGFVHFREKRGTLRTYGAFVPFPIRQRLDSRDALDVVYLQTETGPSGQGEWPHRGMLLSLLAASALTGSLAQSLGGERSDRTLLSLRSAAVSPLEIVVGKWAAWGVGGGLSSLAAAIAACLWGTIEPGMWLVAVPLPAMFAAALGFYALRNAQDVVGGSAVAMRTLPVVLGGSALASWLWVDTSPWWAALMPAGGVLMMAGGLLPGTALQAAAITSTALPIAVMLWGTARALDATGRGASRTTVDDVVEVGVAAALWWTCLIPAAVYTLAGAQAQAARLTVELSVLTAAAALGVVWFLGRLRFPDVQTRAGSGPALRWAAAIALVAVALAAVRNDAGAPPLEAWSVLEHRAAIAVGRIPADVWWVQAVVIAVQEAYLRGRVQGRAGPILPMLAWGLGWCALDPTYGLASGLLLGASRAWTGSWWPGALGRLAALALPTAVPGGLFALTASAVVLAGLAWWDRRPR